MPDNKQYSLNFKNILEKIRAFNDEFKKEYEDAETIAKMLKISTGYVYDIIKANNLETKINKGRTVVKVKDFLNLFTNEKNLKIYEEFYAGDVLLNFCINFDPKNPLEEYITKYLIDKLNEFATVKEVSELLGISTNLLYEEINKGNLLALSIGTRKIIITRSILYYVRNIGNVD